MNNDLIRREDVLGLLYTFVCGVKKYDANDCKTELEKICREELSKALVGILGDFEKLMGELPIIEQPMSAVEYLAAEQRMCFDENVGKRNCSTCPLSSRINPARINCGDYTRQHPKYAVAIVQKWAQEHPERREE